MSNRRKHVRHEEMVDYRDYDQDARNLVRPLSKGQKYDLLDIVCGKLKVSCSDNRRKELEAVKRTIVADRSLESTRVNKIINGPNSEMARTAKAKDGNTLPSRRKV